MFSNISPIAFGSYPDATQFSKPNLSASLSNAFEREADRFGFENCVASGYDPKAMGEMFENMAALRRFYGDNIPEFLLTHPISSTRVSDASLTLVEEIGWVKRNSGILSP